MKHTIIILSFTAVLSMAATSCSKENSLNEVKLEKCSISADVEGTKTGMTDAQGGVKWLSGDAISVFSTTSGVSQGVNNKFTSSDLSGASAKFSGEIEVGTTTMIALYPYTSGASCSGGSISGAVIPATQTATAGSFANGVALAVASTTRVPGGDSAPMTFTNLCSIIGFTIPSDISFAKEITVSSKNGEKLAGTVTVKDNAIASLSNGSASIKVSGSFVGGNTYYIAVAPGTYTGGLNFTISTNGGNSYSRATTKTITAEAGTIYPLGKLGLVMSASDFTASVKLQNTVSGGALTGTNATLTITPKSEFAGNISAYSYTVALKNGSTTYRSLTNATADPRNGVLLTAASNLPYIPKGSYNCEISLYYTTGGVKRGPVTITTTVSQGAPSGFAIDANLSGYTSYSCYKGTDGQSANVSNANNCDNATIYSVGASYKSGLSSAVYSQCSSLLAISSTIDGTAKSGNQGSQSWAAHTIGAKWSFDGASGSCASTKTVYVTGLPYKVTGWSKNGDAKANDNYGNTWSRGSWNNKVDGSCLQLGGVAGSGEASWSSTFHFNVPSSINVALSCPGTTIYTYYFGTKWAGTWQITTFEGYVNGSKAFSQSGPDNSVRESRTFSYNPSGNGSISQDTDIIKFNSTYTAAGPNVHIYKLNLLYR